MKTVILAAGIASRLRPLTDHTPKCLLKVGGKSILELTIENLRETTTPEIIIVTGYLENQIREFVNMNFPEMNITFIHNTVYASTNNIYSLWLARNEILGDDMLMMDSDIVFDKMIITKLLGSGHKNCLALKRHDVQDEEIKVKINSAGRVLEISKVVPPSEAAGESIGIEFFGRETVPELFRLLEKIVVTDKKVNVFYEVAFQELANIGYDLFAVDTSEYFCMEIDTAEDLKTAELLMINHLRNNSQPA
jgi:choline kinase